MMETSCARPIGAPVSFVFDGKGNGCEVIERIRRRSLFVVSKYKPWRSGKDRLTSSPGGTQE